MNLLSKFWKPEETATTAPTPAAEKPPLVPRKLMPLETIPELEDAWEGYKLIRSVWENLHLLWSITAEHSPLRRETWLVVLELNQLSADYRNLLDDEQETLEEDFLAAVRGCALTIHNLTDQAKKQRVLLHRLTYQQAAQTYQESDLHLPSPLEGELA